jgi:lysophospholipase L1-like esterase
MSGEQDFTLRATTHLRRLFDSKLVFALVCGLFAILLAPIPTVTLENEADLSLCTVLDHARQHNLQFGKDIITTYGPLGFLIFPCYSALLGTARLPVDVAMGFVVALGLCRVAWRLRWPAQALLLAAFGWVATNMHWRVEFFPVVALFCWGLNCFCDSGRKLLWSVLFLSGFVAFLCLAKVSLLIAGVITLAVVLCDLCARGRARLALAACGLFAGCLLLGWVVMGQRFESLAPYFHNSVIVAQSYNSALLLEGSAQKTQAAIWLFFLTWLVIFARASVSLCEEGRSRYIRRGLLACWASFFVLMAAKYGVVHQESGHLTSAFGLVPVLALGIESLPSIRAAVSRWSQWGAVTGTVLAMALVQLFFFPPFFGTLRSPFRLLLDNVAAIVDSGGYEARMNDLLERAANDSRLPSLRTIIGQESVDVFGQFQAVALFNNLEYHPRPVPQSYQACDEQLARLNEAFYLGTNAPEYVLFNLHAMDSKLAPLEDSRVLLNLFINYRPLATEGKYTLLRRAAGQVPSLRLVRHGEVRPGESVDLRAGTNASVWIELTLKPSLLGSLRQMLFRPPALRIALLQEPSGPLIVRRHAPAPMLAAGLLANPLLLKTDDFAAFHTKIASAAGSGTLSRPGACSIEIPKSDEQFWSRTVTYRVYAIENTIPAVDSAQVTSARNRPFILFPKPLWVSHELNGWRDNLTLIGLALAPLLTGALAAGFVYWVKRRKRITTLPLLALGNTLVLLFLVSILLAGGEVYCRFFYDTTDALGTTKICQRWMKRHWRTNAWGARDNVEYSTQLTPAKERITFVGDSFTAGHGIKDLDARFPNLIRHAYPEREIHVLANVGLDTGGELKLLEKAFAKGYQADKVVLVYCLNDVGDLLTEEGEPFHGVFDRLHGSPRCLWGSDLLDLVYHRWQAARVPEAANYFSFVKAGYRGQTWERQKERLTKLRDLVQAHGGHLVVVTFPFLHALGPNYEYQFVHDELNEFWATAGVPHLDLLSIYKDIPPEQLTVNRHDAHPNELANQLAAAAIERFLNEQVRR